MVSEVKGIKSHIMQTKIQRIQADSHKTVSRKSIAKMTAEQSMAQAIMQAAIEAAKAAIMAVREADN